MTQFYFSGRIYGNISVRQPLGADQVEQFILQTGETDDMEIYYVMNGAFLVVSNKPGVLFIEDPAQSMGQLCVKLKGSDTFWSMNVTSHTEFNEKAASLLRHADTLVPQFRACAPIDCHSRYRQVISDLMEMMQEKDARSVEARQIQFIKLERQYGTYKQNVALGATV